MPSFDIVSELDKHEVTNAVDQASRELSTRFDFKGVKASFTRNEDSISMEADVDFQLRQMIDMLVSKFVARGLDPKCFEEKDPENLVTFDTTKYKIIDNDESDTSISPSPHHASP